MQAPKIRTLEHARKVVAARTKARALDKARSRELRQEIAAIAHPLGGSAHTPGGAKVGGHVLAHAWAELEEMLSRMSYEGSPGAARAWAILPAEPPIERRALRHARYTLRDVLHAAPAEAMACCGSYAAALMQAVDTNTPGGQHTPAPDFTLTNQRAIAWCDGSFHFSRWQTEVWRK